MEAMGKFCLAAQRTETLKILRNLKKKELEQICIEVGIDSSGLKTTIQLRLCSIIDMSYRFASDSTAGQVNTHLETLNRIFTAVQQANKPNRPFFVVDTPVSASASLQTSASKEESFDSDQPVFDLYAFIGNKKDEKIDGHINIPEKTVGFGPESVLSRSMQNPFFKVKRLISSPFELDRGLGTNFSKTLSIMLPEMDYQEIADSGSGSTDGGGRLRVLMRSFKIDNSDSLKIEERGHLWPMDTTVAVNGLLAPLKQRKLYRQGVHSKLKGDCDPVDLFPYMKKGLNNIEVNCTDAEFFHMLIQVTETVSVQQLLEIIKSRERLTKEAAIERACASFKSSTGNGESDEEELMATSTRLSLRCPLGLIPISDPGRGKHCTHLQCFDITTFLAFNEKNSGAAWRCSVCNTPIDPNDMIVDEYFQQVLSELGDKISDIDEIEIYSDGHWETVKESPFARRSGQKSTRDGRRAMNTIRTDTLNVSCNASEDKRATPISLVDEESLNCIRNSAQKRNDIVDLSLDTDSDDDVQTYATQPLATSWSSAPYFIPQDIRTTCWASDVNTSSSQPNFPMPLPQTKRPRTDYHDWSEHPSFNPFETGSRIVLPYNDHWTPSYLRQNQSGHSLHTIMQGQGNGHAQMDSSPHLTSLQRMFLNEARFSTTLEDEDDGTDGGVSSPEDIFNVLHHFDPDV